jgi:hypothetical protein
MIQRFEDEYPETKIPPLPFGEDLSNPTNDTSISHTSSSLANDSILSASATDTNSLSLIPSGEEYLSAEGEDSHSLDKENHDPSSLALRLSRTSSNTSLASKALTTEEGRMHKFGQGLRREVLKPTGMTDHLHGVDKEDVEPEHLAKLRERLEEFQGEEIRQRVLRDGAEKVIRDIGTERGVLEEMRKRDPEGWERMGVGVLVNEDGGKEER